MQSKNYEEDAKLLREAMKGFGTDEAAIIKLTGNRSNEERLNIKIAYKASYGRDLLADLADELSGDFKKIVMGMYLSPIEYDVLEIYNAVKGMGTDEDTLTEILGSRSNYRLRDIKKLYYEKYKEKLEDRVIDETSGDYKSLLISILQCNRDESQNVNEGLVDQDVKDLYKAGEGRWGTDEEVFNRIFALRSSYHLRALNNSYKKINGKNLLEVVESEFSGDLKVLLKTILHSHINPADYYAHRIYKACKGWGTNDSMLIRSLITMDEVYMEEIKNIYKSKFGMTLAQQITDETSGDYKKMLLELISH